MANVLEIIVRAKDEASRGLQAVGSSVERMSGQLKVAGAAMTAIGIAGSKMAADARKMSADLGYTGAIIGATTDEMRDMALSITDVTFGLKTVSATLEQLARAGVKDQATMKANALALDALADATKSTADQVANVLIPAYKMFGAELPKTAQEMDKWTYLVTTTNVELSELGSLMGYVATYGQDLNLTAEQLVLMMKAMAEQGRSASDAARLLRTGINQAEGSTEKLFQIIGITNEELETYRQEMEDATGITEDLQRQQTAQYTVMDRVKQKFQELELYLAPVLQVLEPIFAVMTALGPAMLTAVYVIPKLSAAFVRLKGAMLGLQWQAVATWGAVTLGASLAIAGIVSVVNASKNAEAETEEYNQALKDLATTMKRDVKNAAQTMITQIQAENQVAIDAINERRRLWKETHWERMNQLTEQFIAELRAISPETYAKLFEPLEEGGKSLYQTYLDTTQAIEDTQAAIDALRVQEIGEELRILDPKKDQAEILRLQLELYQLQLPDLDRQFAEIMQGAEIPEEDVDTYFDKLVTGAGEAAQDAADEWRNIWEKEFGDSMEWSRLQLENFLAEDLPALWEKYFPGMEMPEYELPTPPPETKSFWEKILGPLLERGGAGGVRMYQAGGIVTRPTLGVVGEAGPEAIIPLSRLGGGLTVNVGYLMGDEASLRRFARELQQMMGEESRRTQFGQVQAGYFWGRSSV